MRKIIKNLLFIFFIGLVFFAQKTFAITATLYGEVTDDGGDPYLYVWFQYGKTTSYGFETPRQPKYGIGEFSATISNLEECTTYHYRAVVKHQNYDDTKYGEDKTFTTPCPSLPLPTVDLKANGSDGPITISHGSSVTLTWTSSNSNYCVASNGWSGTKSISGSEIVQNLTSSKTFTLTCYGSGGSVADSVTVYVQQVLSVIFPTISKTVRNLSDGQVNFSKSVFADPGEVLEFQIIVDAGSGISNAILKDIPSDRVSIRSGSLKIDGKLIAGDIQRGILLGNLTANQKKKITFLADISSSANFQFGTTNLTNTAILSWNGNSISDGTTISVRKTGTLGAVTGTPTGFILNTIFEFSLIFLGLFLFLFKSSIFEFEDWLKLKKLELRRAISRGGLFSKIIKIKSRK